MISIRNSYNHAVHLETLRLYCDVVRLRSFSRGATQNFVSQSAASQAMQQLEAELGVTLLDRTKRPFVVTPEGQAFYEACRGLLEAWDKAKAGIAAVKARVDGTVRVAAIYSVGLHDVSRHVQRFMSLYPEARVQLECVDPHLGRRPDGDPGPRATGRPDPSPPEAPHADRQPIHPAAQGRQRGTGAGRRTLVKGEGPQDCRARSEGLRSDPGERSHGW